MVRAVRLVGNILAFILDYLLAGGSLVAVIILLVLLNEIISEKRASYPQLLPISGSSLSKPIFVRSVPVGTPRTFRGLALSVSPDGNRIAYWGGAEGAEDPGFFVARVDADRDWLVWPFVAGHSWAPDSQRIVLQARQEAFGAVGIAIANVDDLIDSRTASAIDWIFLPPDEAAINSPPVATTATWTPDGKAVLFVLAKAGDRVSELWRADLETGQKQRLASLPREPDKPNTYVRSLSASPDGKKVAFINADRPGGEVSSTWWIMNLDGSSPLPLMRRSAGAGFVRGWRWFPDGRRLIYDVRTAGDANFQPTTLWTMNVDGTSARQIGLSDNVEGFAPAPKGMWAIYGQDSHLWLANLESGREEQVTFGDDHESLPMWLASGDVLYHHKVGGQTTLRRLIYAEAADIPGIGDAAQPKGP